MLVGHSDLVMRQEQYQDLLREAKQERFIQANGLRRSSSWRLSWNLVEIIRVKFGKPQQPPQLKRATP
jgi:hypothetical protein